MVLGARNYGDGISHHRSRLVIRIMFPLLLVAIMASAGKLYVMQETVVLLLLLGVLTATILVLAIVFILSAEGVSRAIL
jgi:uncharacterized membrane protein